MYCYQGEGDLGISEPGSLHKVSGGHRNYCGTNTYNRSQAKQTSLCSWVLTLKSIQRRAARIFYNDFSRFDSVTRMMSSPTLEERSNKCKLTTMYRIINGNLTHNLITCQEKNIISLP